MNSSAKITFLTSITVWVYEYHHKVGGHINAIVVVTKLIWGGHERDMLIDRFRIELSESFAFINNS